MFKTDSTTLCRFPLIIKIAKPFFILLLLVGSFNSLSQNISRKHDFKTVRAKMSNLAADAVGVNTHLNFGATLYATHYDDIIKPRLIELGVKHIRDHFGDEKINARYLELAHNYGIKLLLINNDEGADLEYVKNEVKKLNLSDSSKPVIDLIEPANERDVGWKKDWARLCEYMYRYRNVFKGDSITAAIPLLGPSFADTRHSAVDFGRVCSNASINMEIGNLHAYSGLYPESPLAGGWGMSFDQAIENYRSISQNKPIVESESGYKMSEGESGHPAVSQRTAAKYSPRLVLERLRRGVSRLYFYQLINAAEDFGMLNDDGSPRLQFTSLKNFIHLLADDGGGFKPGTLKYSLNGDLKDIYQMLFQKSDGKYLLIIWQGINGSDLGTKNNDYRDLENRDRMITLNLAQKAKIVNIYRPSFDHMPDGNGSKPVASFKSKAVVKLAVPDHIVIVELSF